eukprot:TRINITY_DN2262_c0_g1_i1.p1 TRINITY_DN2262_c0_g1~~TRINITY_DN2262_c0_g1_i1.p1  ORF type:complete len:260 (+),score=28.43 TRINITY_DN2262_c0_g1_i1:47-826(+)
MSRSSDSISSSSASSIRTSTGTELSFTACPYDRKQITRLLFDLIDCFPPELIDLIVDYIPDPIRVCVRSPTYSCFIGRAGSVVTTPTKHSEAAVFELVPAKKKDLFEPLFYGDEFYLRSIMDGQYFQRGSLAQDCEDSPKVGPHFTYRFRMCFSPDATQTIEAKSNSSSKNKEPLAWKRALGLTFGGQSQEMKSPGNTDRRYLTLRPFDVTVVVNWLQSDEQIELWPEPSASKPIVSSSRPQAAQVTSLLMKNTLKKKT